MSKYFGGRQIFYPFRVAGGLRSGARARCSEGLLINAPTGAPSAHLFPTPPHTTHPSRADGVLQSFWRSLGFAHAPPSGRSSMHPRCIDGFIALPSFVEVDVEAPHSSRQSGSTPPPGHRRRLVPPHHPPWSRRRCLPFHDLGESPPLHVVLPRPRGLNDHCRYFVIRVRFRFHGAP